MLTLSTCKTLRGLLKAKLSVHALKGKPGFMNARLTTSLVYYMTFMATVTTVVVWAVGMLVGTS